MAYKLAEAHMQPTETVQSSWTVTAPAGTPREAPLDPAFWVHVAGKLRPLAEITVIPQDGAWYAKYLVLYVSGPDVRVKELSFWDLDDGVPAVETDIYAVQWGGPVHKFRVARASDGKVMQTGFVTKSEAFHWISRNTVHKAA